MTEGLQVSVPKGDGGAVIALVLVAGVIAVAILVIRYLSASQPAEKP